MGCTSFVLEGLRHHHQRISTLEFFLEEPLRVTKVVNIDRWIGLYNRKVSIMFDPAVLEQQRLLIPSSKLAIEWYEDGM